MSDPHAMVDMFCVGGPQHGRRVPVRDGAKRVTFPRPACPRAVWYEEDQVVSQQVWEEDVYEVTPVPNYGRTIYVLRWKEMDVQECAAAAMRLFEEPT